MKTIDNLNITEITFRNHKEFYGSGKTQEKRLALLLEDSFNKKLNEISKEIGVKTTEIIRQTILLVVTQCEDTINENDN